MKWLSKGVLFLEALALALVVKLLLTWGSLRQTRRILDRRVRPTPQPWPFGPRPVVWAVEAVGRRVPVFRNCLVQALVAWAMLRRRGFRPQIQIGVAQGEAGQILAHAWLELEGRVILGGPGSAQFQRFPGDLHA